MLIPYSGEVALIKLAGYSAAGVVLRRVYGSRFNYFVFGLLRFLAGTIVFVALAIAIESILGPERASSTADFIALLIERIIVWSAMIFLVFQMRHGVGKISRFWFCVIAGIAWSYCLDGVVALLRSLIPGFGTMIWC